MNYHLVWGAVTFVMLIVATAYAVRELGSKSTLFRTGIAAIVDYVVQIILGFVALGPNGGAVVVVHLTNAFLPESSLLILSVSPIAPTRLPLTFLHKLKPYGEGISHTS